VFPAHSMRLEEETLHPIAGPVIMRCRIMRDVPDALDHPRSTRFKIVECTNGTERRGAQMCSSVLGLERFSAM